MLKYSAVEEDAGDALDDMYAPFYLPAPFCAMGEKVDFVCLIATMPGRHSGDQVHKVKKTAAPLFLYFTGPVAELGLVHGREVHRPAAGPAPTGPAPDQVSPERRGTGSAGESTATVMSDGSRDSSMKGVATRLREDAGRPTAFRYFSTLSRQYWVILYMYPCARARASRNTYGV